MKLMKSLSIVALTTLSISAYGMYNTQAGRFMKHDPGEYVDSVNLYEYVCSDPVCNLDPHGYWKITVHFPKKDRYYAGDLILFDKYERPVLYAVARGQGKFRRDSSGDFIYNSAGHRISLPWWKPTGDTPTGHWKGQLMAAAVGKVAIERYGPHKKIRLTAVKGNAKRAVTEFGRSLFRIHGGRSGWITYREVNVISGWQPIKDKGKIIGWKPIWSKRNTAIPGNTEGCIRLTDSDMGKLVKAIETLVTKRCEEKVGMVVVTGPQGNPPKPDGD